jgi:hypothetical protein
VNTENVKLIVFVPETYAGAVRGAMGDAGAGVLGNYSHCTFSVKGVGRFKPLAGADPHIGTEGALEEVVEERIEVVCPREKLARVVQAIKDAHPYEEVPIDVYPMEEDW